MTWSPRCQSRARAFYVAVFDFSLDANPDLPGLDFTFLRRPDGHEIGGILGDPAAVTASWRTLFEVEDTDATVARVIAAGGTSTTPSVSRCRGTSIRFYSASAAVPAARNR